VTERGNHFAGVTRAFEDDPQTQTLVREKRSFA
jgi:hypothetical protein